jgi:hypothetical protein
VSLIVYHINSQPYYTGSVYASCVWTAINKVDTRNAVLAGI